MLAIANTTVSILRGTTTDEYGDEEPSGTAVYEHLPASLIEQTRTVFNADNPTPRVVRIVKLRLPNGTDLRTDDQVRDERSGIIYWVDDFVTPANGVLAADLSANLRRTT